MGDHYTKGLREVAEAIRLSANISRIKVKSDGNGVERQTKEGRFRGRTPVICLADLMGNDMVSWHVVIVDYLRFPVSSFKIISQIWHTTCCGFERAILKLYPYYQVSVS